ncbi:hypothetical protein MKX01_030527 [Papaver californicum]|nr:hypothetical protein MKX01_030527 [Papaver californicum]
MLLELVFFLPIFFFAWHEENVAKITMESFDKVESGAPHLWESLMKFSQIQKLEFSHGTSKPYVHIFVQTTQWVCISFGFADSTQIEARDFGVVMDSKWH